MFIAPWTVFAQASGPAAVVGGVNVDSGTAAAVTKFLTDIVRRFWNGEKQAPGVVPLLAAAIIGPISIAFLLVQAGVSLFDGKIIAGTIMTGIFVAAGGAVLLTAGHDVSRDPAANIPSGIAERPKEEQLQLCCLHGDCRIVQQAKTQAAAGQSIIPVENTPVPTSPPDPPPEMITKSVRPWERFKKAS